MQFDYNNAPGNLDDSSSSGNVEDSTSIKSQLGNATIEQEAEVSNHTEASDIHLKDRSEPAPPGQPKSIASDDRS